MLPEARDLQNNAVSRLVSVLKESKKEFTFKAPTGSGKTFMMADFMNRIISENNKIVFIVSTLSKSNLAEQNFESFKDLSEKGIFPLLNPFLINSDSSGEGSLYIPVDYNVYVLPRDLYKEKSKLKNEGTFQNFLQTMTDTLFSPDTAKSVYLIKDECHIATNNLDELKDYFEKIINFSATPKLSRNQNPDVEITNEEAESAKLIKSVAQGAEGDTLKDALEKFEEIKPGYINSLGVNPCLIIQISNKDKADDELENNIFPALSKHQDLKWVYITGEDKSCKTNDAGFNKIPVSRWKDYMKERVSSISVIIFKMVISEGWDIPRACMLYQIRDSQSKQLDEQVMGRVRRNPRLLDFETLSEEAKELALTAWIWGIVPPTKTKILPVKLFKNYNIEHDIRVKPTKLENIAATQSFNLQSFVKGLSDDKLDSTNIFELFRDLARQDFEIQKMCYDYASSFEKWRIFAEHLSNIKKSYDAYICDYNKSMVVCDDVTFPYDSSYEKTDNSVTIDDWVWRRNDNENDFSFDSDAERKWAELLKDIRYMSIGKTSTLTDSNKFLWGKNYLSNSEIKFEYYLDGVHSSYPDFIMKDKNGVIHIFEVKSINKKVGAQIDEEEYKKKVKALKDCYKACSEKTDHIFYIPLMTGSDWQIFRYSNGDEKKINKQQFIESFEQRNVFVDGAKPRVELLKVADSKKKKR